MIWAARGGDSVCGNSRTGEGGSDSALTPYKRNLILRLTKVKGWTAKRDGLMWGIQTGDIFNLVALARDEAELEQIEREAHLLLPRRRNAR